MSTTSDWIEHDGGPCPFPYSTRVYVRLTGGLEDRKATFAGFWRSHGADRWRRQHDWRIEAYRLADAGGQ